MRRCIPILLLLFAGPAFGQIYVDSSATGTDDGSSWADAYTDLQDALSAATVGDEIWVAQGAYKPTGGLDRAALFDLVSGVKLYGGFAGGEIALEQRDFVTNETILSGEIGAPGPNDNSYQVVRALSVSAETVLDGFTIRDGFNDIGICGGLRITGTFCNPIIRNLLVTNNTAIDGGGIFVNAFNHNAKLSNIVVTNNTATNDAGGIYILDTDKFSAPTWMNITIADNDAARWGGGIRMHNSALLVDGFEIKRNTANIGGGIRVQTSDLTLHNGIITDNDADFSSGGGIFALAANTLLLYNVAVYGNSANNDGGGVLSSNAAVSLINVTIVENTAGGAGGGLSASVGVSADVINTIIADNTAPTDPQVEAFGSGGPDFYHSLIEGSGGSSAWDPSLGTDLGGNIDGVSHVIDPAGDDFRLYYDSPAIDAGDGGAPTAFDLSGDARIVGAAIDMGATEFRGCPLGTRLYVKKGATGSGDGSSWGDAYTEVREALAMACPNIDEMWIAAGAYSPSAAQDQFRTFELRNGLTLYGGFAGVETAFSQRNVLRNTSLLDGNNTSFNVIVGSGTDATAVVDGVSIARGAADTFSPNGGGVFNDAGSPTIRNAIFYDNGAVNGGGMANFNGSAPLIENVLFTDNRAAFGGGMYNDASSPCLVNVVFDRNTGYNQGASLVNVAASTAILTNCTIGLGVGVVPGIINAASSPIVTNSIVWVSSGSPVTNLTGANPVFSYSLIQGSGGSAAWNPSFGTDGGNNIDVDPLFADPANGNLRLLSGSPAFDVGDDNAPKLPATDIDGGARIVGVAVDMGAYESPVATGIADVIARDAGIRSTYPNPFNPTVTVAFELDAPLVTSLQIFDARGRLVRTLLDGALAAGVHHEKWDARNNSGTEVSSGVYFVVMRAGAARDRRKITLLK